MRLVGCIPRPIDRSRFGQTDKQAKSHMTWVDPSVPSDHPRNMSTSRRNPFLFGFDRGKLRQGLLDFPDSFDVYGGDSSQRTSQVSFARPKWFEILSNNFFSNFSIFWSNFSQKRHDGIPLEELEEEPLHKPRAYSSIAVLYGHPNSHEKTIRYPCSPRNPAIHITCFHLKLAPPSISKTSTSRNP